MEYKGKLYGKIGMQYFELNLNSDDVDALQAENERLRDAIKAAIKEAESEPDSNDGLFLALETLKKAIGK